MVMKMVHSNSIILQGVLAIYLFSVRWYNNFLTTPDDKTKQIFIAP